MKKTAAVIETRHEPKTCDMLARENDMTEFEFHKRIASDDAFAYQIIKDTLGMKDADWNQLPLELLERMREDFGNHAKEYVFAHEHPILAKMSELSTATYEFLKPAATWLGFASMVAMIVWYARLLVK